MSNITMPYRKVKNLRTCLALLISIGVPSMMQAGNLTSIAQLLGNPGDLGTDVTITSTLGQLCADVTSVADNIGEPTDTALTTDLADTKAEIDALEESVCALLKTVLLQLAEIKALVTP